MVRKTEVQSQVESYQRLKKCYLMPPCFTLSIIRYGSRVKWNNPGNGIAPHPWLRSPTTLYKQSHLVNWFNSEFRESEIRRGRRDQTRRLEIPTSKTTTKSVRSAIKPSAYVIRLSGFISNSISNQLTYSYSFSLSPLRLLSGWRIKINPPYQANNRLVSGRI